MRKLIALAVAVCSAALVSGPAWAANRIIDISDSEKVQVFDEPGNYNWLAPNNLVGTVQLLVVGGGGAGGGIGAGGGGGGEVFYADAVSLTAGATYSISVGAGGAGVSKSSGGNGFNSSITGQNVSYTVVGGGGGAGGWSRAKGKDGGSGGGGGGNGDAEIDGGASTATIGMGNPGAPAGTTYWSPGGGGGAMEVGHRFDEEGKKGYGGAGYVCAITGDDKMYGYGGGAGATLGALSGAGIKSMMRQTRLLESREPAAVAEADRGKVLIQVLPAAAARLSSVIRLTLPRMTFRLISCARSKCRRR